MKSNLPESHHHSLRLKGYDYTSEGLYFITICNKDRQHYFGKVTKGEMFLNEIGKVAEKFLLEVSEHFNQAMVSDYVVMPNHVHLILVLNDKRKFVSDAALMDEGTRHAVGTCHGMSLHECGDAPVETRHGVSPPIYDQ